MALADRANELLDGLPRGWNVARIDVTVEDPAEADRAALILAPAMPGRAGSSFSLFVRSGPDGTGPTPALARRVLSRLDETGVRARLKPGPYEIGDETTAPPVAREQGGPRSLAAAWDALVTLLPGDWSDLYVELRLDSTDFVERAALLLAPMNPSRSTSTVGFRFRAAHRFGYGVAPQMARRALERLDEEGITGGLAVLKVLSDTRPVATQGPVWRVGGRAV